MTNIQTMKTKTDCSETRSRFTPSGNDNSVTPKRLKERRAWLLYVLMIRKRLQRMDFRKIDAKIKELKRLDSKRDRFAEFTA